MTAKNTRLYTAEQVRELDRIAIQDRGIPGITLMKRAGRATLNALLEHFPAPAKITIYCGAGNNGGDGYIVAGLAKSRKIAVEVIEVTPGSKLKGDARTAYEFAAEQGVPIIPFDDAKLPEEGVIVDALLGTGLRGEVRSPFNDAIAGINGADLPVVAVDIPSGLSADSGAVLGEAVKADITVTFIGRKQGHYTGAAPAHCGRLVFDDLGVPPDIYDQMTGCCQLLDWQTLRQQVPARPADAHKGLYGHVMIIGGELGFGGAVLMAAQAALRVGAGLVSVATRPQHVNAIIARCPEVMAIGVASGQELEPQLVRPTVLVVGPGLGRTPWSEQMLQKAIGANLPMVLDADALNILSDGRVGAGADLSRTVMTPHPGEAARLLGVSNGDIQRDRFAAARQLQAWSKGTVLLKGAGTLIAAAEDAVSVCPFGNPGMATGGMGDILSGVIGGLMAQGFSSTQAAETGACLHGLAGDDAAEQDGMVGLCATDLMPHLRARMNRE